MLFERLGRGLKPLAMALKLAESARAMELNANELQSSVSSSDDAVRITASQPLPACCCRHYWHACGMHCLKFKLENNKGSEQQRVKSFNIIFV